MARRKRRKSAGPPPAHNPRRAAVETSGAATTAAAKRRPGEPVPPTIKGVLIRVGVVSAIFLVALIYVVGETPGAALLVTLLAVCIMIPLGLFLDRYRYKRELRKWEERRARPSGR
jgi:hypothetical protein